MEKNGRKGREHSRMRPRLIHPANDTRRGPFPPPPTPPLSASTSYRLGSVHRGAQGFVEFASPESDAEGHKPVYVYDRLDEPTRGLLEESLAAAEGGERAVAFARGMAAVAAAVGVTLKAGDEIVAHQTLYGCTYSLFTEWLPRYEIPTRFSDTPVNPTLELIDIREVRVMMDEIAAGREQHNRAVMVVDNTFATPFCQRPLELGADLVVQSLSKDIGGFGTDMGGACICSKQFHALLLHYRKDTGGVLSPKNAWPILVYGLPTLAARMTNQQKTALRVAQFLEQHPKVARVSYPGLETHPQYQLARRQMTSYDGQFAPGSMLYFVLKGDEKQATEAANKFIDYVADHAYSVTLAVSLGQLRTLIEEPYTMTHSMLPDDVKRRRGMEPGGIRLSVGLEDWHDITEDLRAAFEQI